MKKYKIRETLNNRRILYGGYSAIITIVFIIFILLMNLTLDNINLKVDLTKEKIFSLSEQSQEVADNLQEDITITGLFTAGKEDLSIKEVLAKYKSVSNKIKIDYKDPELYPQFVKKYSKTGETLTLNSLIVESGNKFKIIDPSKFIESIEGYNGQVVAQALILEQRITGAIMYVTREDEGTIYQLRGHEETDIQGTIKAQLETENYRLQDLDLLKTEWKPKKGDLLVVISPKRDISVEEEEQLRSYFENGGRGIFFIDLLNKETPNLQSLMEYYGISIKQAAVLEGEVENRYSAKNPLFLLPKIGEHPILKNLRDKNLRVLVPVAQPIETLKAKRNTVEIVPLLTTTDKSWGKINLESDSLEKEAGDLEGSFNIAVAIGDGKNLNDISSNAKIVVISSALMLDENVIAQSNGSNMDFFMNCLSWMGNRQQNMSIRPKSISVEALKMNSAEQIMYSGIVVIVIPLLIGIGGTAVWLRRRHL